MIVLRNRIKEEKIVQYHVGQAFFHQADPGLEAFPMFCQGWLVDPFLLEMVYRKTLNFNFLEILRPFNTL